MRPPPNVRRGPPLDLPRLVMRRAARVALAVLGLALVLGLLRMAGDIEQEVDAAASLATGLARVQALSSLDDATARAQLRTWRAELASRHLLLQVRDAAGQPLLAPEANRAADADRNVLLRALLDIHRRWSAPPVPVTVQWPLPRPAGGAWTVSLQTSPESERSEALLNLLGMLGLLLLCVAGLLLAMQANLRRAFAPLQPLLQAIARIEQHDTTAVRALPAMPVRELDAVAQALRHLAQALEAAEAERRTLSQRVITLQEDERARLARELHDEFGQQLTALRVDSAWLARRVQSDPEALVVVQAQIGHCQHIQQALRSVLARLRPLPALADEGEAGGLCPLAVLHEMLQLLVQGWSAPSQAGTRVELQWDVHDGVPAGTALPQPLALAIYRITQEALTNVARHAAARRVQVQLAVQPGDSGLCIDWQVIDDGIGIAEPAASLGRGSGLAGIKQRVWAQGAELQLQPARPGQARPGLRLSARFEAVWAAA